MFPSARILIDVGDHLPIENGLAIGRTIVGTIQTDDGAGKIDAHGLGEPHEGRQGLPQQRRFVVVAGSGNKRRDHIAAAVAESHDLVAFHFLVAAEAQIVPTFLGCRGRAVAMHLARVQLSLFVVIASL